MPRPPWRSWQCCSTAITTPGRRADTRNRPQPRSIPADRRPAITPRIRPRPCPLPSSHPSRSPAFESVLFLRITPFTATGEPDHEALKKHIGTGLDAGPSAVFVACGTGEFHPLDTELAAIVADGRRALAAAG
ncbi:dihydrodipicolinate synthase family protein [Streptomyces malaysiensis]|uniref:Dihydrodipicolinate synthase family protein n=1 Tax=Streptomyces malaysiensis subsp. samsunensis TaxID=459658 RepID=A0A9X2RV86_STRMQ|nr:dihydrodipicolinate synthase family protein [Streptomyces samsunensis]MCQ8829935.1 dihydrodipicolinate synthase family protein [Streptomyces samsunensis]